MPNDDARCCSVVHAMYGYTGTWQGQRVSAQGSRMGQPAAEREQTFEAMVRIALGAALDV